MEKTALDKFYENDVNPLFKEALNNLENDFQQNRKELKKAFIHSFKGICVNIKEEEKSGRIKTGFIIYNLLRTRIIQHKYEYMVIVYDRDWYLKDGIKAGEFDVSFFYRHFEDVWQKLLKIFRKYVMQISIADVERIMFDHLDYFHKYVVELMRYSLIDALDTDEYLALDKEEIVEIQSGEYYEPCDIIHMEHKGKNHIEIKKWLDENKKMDYCFQDFRGIDLCNLHYHGIDLRYTDFRDSRLDGVNIFTGLLMGTKFKNSSMKDANLMVCMIHDANFENADMTGAKFQYCVTFTGKNEVNRWKYTGFTGTSFKNSILKGADFTRATIIGADFEGADLTGAIFDEAKLYRSRFTKNQLEQIKLTKEQLEQIKVI
jgi:uncharacterized protein YjbI with pentapeptide repeats